MSRHLTGPRRYAELSSNANQTSALSDYNQDPGTYASNTNQYNSQAPVSGQSTASYTEPYNAPSQQAQAKTQANTNPTPNFQTPAQSNVAETNPRRKSSKSKMIDTDKIPRPNINADSSYCPGDFVTSNLSAPPSSFTGFITVDDGNAGPRYIRSSFYKLPQDENLINNTQIPLGMIIQPFADPSPDEEPVSIVDYGEEGPLRCNRCRAYVNPNWTFVKNGSYAVCNLCRMNVEIPKEYYSPLDDNGLRADRFDKPELSKGVYEFLAPSAYHMRPLVTNNILFCIEASSETYFSGIFHQILSSITSLLDYIPSPELTKICIVTYDTGVNFFKVPSDLTKEISITHVTDIDTPCLPYPKSYYFLSLTEERDKINYLIERITHHYESSEKIQKGIHGTCFGAALVDSCDILLKDGGRVLAFTAQAPTAGLGKITKREDLKIHGTDKEKTLFVPQVEDYAKWATRSLEKRVCVDLFCFSPDYFDLVTIGQISAQTGGNLYYYPSYKSGFDGEKLHYDMARNLTRYIGFDAIMTVRTPQGISFTNYITPAGRKTDAELHFSALDADTSINAFFKHDEKLAGEDAGFQVAVLYSNPYGQRVIRIINLKISISNDLVAIFRNADVEAVAQLSIKKNILNISTTPIPQIRKTMQDLLIAILYNYRHHCASTSSQSQLVLPEALKVLPMYFLGIFKSLILRTSDTKPDDRAYDLFRFMKMPVNVFSNLLYPKVYPLHTIWTEDAYAPGNIVENRTVLSPNLPATDEKIDDEGIYLIDNNEFLYLYVKKSVDPVFIQHLFGVETYQEVAALTSFPDYIESEYFTKVYNIIEQLRKNKNASYQPVRIVTEKDPSEQIVLSLLVEDERLGESYSSFLCTLHKFIQDKSS